jgi:predicted kinase
MILEPDQYYYEDGEYRWSPEKRAAAWADCYRKLAETLARGAARKVVLLVGLPGSGKSTFARAHDAEDLVIFDGLFIDRTRRSRVLEIAREANVPVEAVWFDLPLELCRQRNAGRSLDRRIPEDVLSQLHQQLANDPPSLAEGFASLQQIASA